MKYLFEYRAMLRVLQLTALAFVSCAGLADDVKIKPFASDACSSFPEGTLEQEDLWLACCTQHDFAYWQGGTYQQRLDADLELQECVADVGEPDIANLMLLGVRVGGSPYWPTEFRWGYGWPYLRGYEPLSEEEQQQVLEALKDYQEQTEN